MIPGVPYDAEIEYLESTGTQWIDTGVNYFPDFEIECRLSENVPNKTIGNGIYYCLQRQSSTFPNWQFSSRNGNNYNSSIKITEQHVLSWKENKIYADGIFLTLFAKSKNPGNTCCLFAVSNTSIWPCTIYYVKLYDDSGILVRDFIPVRVGQTGYMYDRVSKRLFGNKGTGSFVLGPDVAKPVIGLWGMRKFYNARDYVQDGLVAMFDGIENAAWGVHDSSLKEWADLTGNETPLIAWTKNDLMFGKMGAYNFRGYIQNDVTERDYRANGFTLELVAPGGWLPRTNLLNGNSNMLGSAAWQSNDYYRFNSFGTDGGAPHMTGAYASITRPYCGMSIQPTGQGSAYVYGGSALVLSMTTASTPLKLNGSARIRIGAGNGGVRYGPICRIAVYNRALSPAEIAHNYAIDKERFNLP